MTPSLDAHRYLKGSMRLCSWEADWRSVLLREYDDPPSVEELTTAATPDYFLSLVTAGSCHIDSWRDGRWRGADYQAGSLGFRSRGVSSVLRWSSDESHRTLQLYLPAELFDDVTRDTGRPGGDGLPPRLFLDDPLVGAVMVAMKRALLGGAPDLYAETSAQLLAAHLSLRYGAVPAPGSVGQEDRRLQRANAYLRDHLAEPVTLAAIARAAGLSRFHLIRQFKQAYGETPLKRLTRLRMAKARRLLRTPRSSVTQVGLDCGYGNSAHFATAFRRHVGLSPSDYRS
jgi:AraC family transcriptional regulator